jgi:hypothetical protein
MLNVTGIAWCEKRLIGKLYIGQSVKPKADQGAEKKCKDWKRR